MNKKQTPALTAPTSTDPKSADLERNREYSPGTFLTTNQGLKVNDDQNSLKAGDRGPTLLEDFILREKITHFDHERIPERVVHARGAAAHGYFEAYDTGATYSKAGFLQPGTRTSVFTRFSTVAGSRGSTDLARDVRGFAVKFYTEEGNFDLVGNNMPVFFIQDAIKFPDFVHAVKPEPDSEMPQAASAHNTFWDFISINPESMHMIMWVMSDRSLPRSYRMMEGFGVHTFRLIDAAGVARFVKFHWKPVLGSHAVVWEEAQMISGKDPDFHRRDLWKAIEDGAFPEWELGAQVIEEKDEMSFDFDILDPTKLIPEELVPIVKLGKMVLNRNPDNFFAETEQVAYHLGHIVPGIDFSNDPLLQGRLFSYTDTQLTRLGGPNFHEIPINRPVCPFHNGQRDGHMRQEINVGKTSYSPNLLNGNAPMQAKQSEGGFASYQERVEGSKVRARSKSFLDHYTQAAMFYQSMTEIEQVHIIKALRFELGKVELDDIRDRMLIQLTQVDASLAARVANGLGLEIPSAKGVQLNLQVPADADPASYASKPRGKADPSPALSMVAPGPGPIATRMVAILAADGVDSGALNQMKKDLGKAGVNSRVVGTHGGNLKAKDGSLVPVDFTFQTGASVLFDAVYVPGGEKGVAVLVTQPDAVHFVNEAYRHCKPIAASGAGNNLLKAAAYAGAADILTGDGVILANEDAVPSAALMRDIAQHRFWSRELSAQPKV